MARSKKATIKTDQNNPVIFKFKIYSISVGIPNHMCEKVNQAFNIAWGFPDGNCNYVNDDGVIVSKPEADNPDFCEAASNMHRNQIVNIEVSVHKDGSKSFKII